LAEELGKTRAQIALNWCISRPNVIAIPKSDSISRTVENCEAGDWKLTADQVRMLDEAYS
jgi:diketogulonate reductase-like aldo/keto reductase